MQRPNNDRPSPGQGRGGSGQHSIEINQVSANSFRVSADTVAGSMDLMQRMQQAGFGPGDFCITTGGPCTCPRHNQPPEMNAAFDWVRISRDEPRRRIGDLPIGEQRMIKNGELFFGDRVGERMITGGAIGNGAGLVLSAPLTYVDLGWWHYQSKNHESGAGGASRVFGQGNRMPPPGEVFICASKQHIRANPSSKQQSFAYSCHVQRTRSSAWDSSATAIVYRVNLLVPDQKAEQICQREVDEMDSFVSPYVKFLVDESTNSYYLFCAPRADSSIVCLKLDGIKKTIKQKLIRGDLPDVVLRDSISWAIIGDGEFLLVAVEADEKNPTISNGNARLYRIRIMEKKLSQSDFMPVKRQMKIIPIKYPKPTGFTFQDAASNQLLRAQWSFKRLETNGDQQKFSMVALCCSMEKGKNPNTTEAKTTIPLSPFIFEGQLNLQDGKKDVINGKTGAIVRFQQWPSPTFAKCIKCQLIGQYRNWTIVYFRAAYEKLGQVDQRRCFLLSQLIAIRRDLPSEILSLPIAAVMSTEAVRIMKAIPRLLEFLGFQEMFLTNNNHLSILAQYEFNDDEQFQRILTIGKLAAVLNRKCANCGRRNRMNKKLLVCNQCKLEKKHKAWWKYPCHFCDDQCFRDNWTIHMEKCHNDLPVD